MGQRRILKKIWLTILILFFSGAACAEDHSYRLNTSYPAPYGAYTQIRLYPTAYSEITPCKVGTMYFNSNGHLRICENDATGVPVWAPPIIWGKDSNQIFLKDSEYKKVGIGATNPEFRLSLDNDGGIIATGAAGSGWDLQSSGAGAKFIWYSRKAAFRAGVVSGTQWDKVNIGVHSVASGYNTTAQGLYSSAFGYETMASGTGSIAMGYQTVAREGVNSEASVAIGNQTTTANGADGAVAIGYHSHANSSYSIALGSFCQANNTYAVALGTQVIAKGNSCSALGHEVEIASGASGAVAIGYQSTVADNSTNSIAMGYQASVGTGNDAAVSIGINAQTGADHAFALGRNVIASGVNSTCIGFDQTASGRQSFAIGYNAYASGQESFALGRFVKSQAYGGFVFGRYNIITGNTASWVNSDPLFVIGNGTADTNRKNALTVLKNGKVGIKTSNPTSPLHIAGVLEYADNASAIAAGLSAGDFYRTGDNLMVVY